MRTLRALVSLLQVEIRFSPDLLSLFKGSDGAEEDLQSAKECKYQMVGILLLLSHDHHAAHIQSLPDLRYFLTFPFLGSVTAQPQEEELRFVL